MPNNPLDPLGIFERDGERVSHAIAGMTGPGHSGPPVIPDARRALGLVSTRRMELVNVSIAKDVGGWLLGLAPVVGTALSDIWTDNLDADMHRRMTPGEASTLRQETRWLPDTIALIRTFQSQREP